MIDFNKPPGSSGGGGSRGSGRPYHDQDALSAALAACAQRWVPEVFPAGRIDKRKGELRVADISGTPPRNEGSCVIQLRGKKAGSYHDFGIDKGGQPLATVGDHFGLADAALFAKAAELVERYGGGLASNVVPLPLASSRDQAADARKLVLAQHELSRAGPTQGTLADVYFKARGLAPPTAQDLLFSPEATYYPSDGNPIAQPALIARVRYPSGQPTGGIHRTFLKADGSGRLEKMALGPTEGGVIKLAEPTEAGELGIAEGIEDAASVMQLTGLPCWSGISTGHLRHLANTIRHSGLPGVKKLYIFADRGRDGESTAEILRACAVAAGIQTQVVLPRSDDDFNGDLQQGLPAPDLAAPQPTSAESLMAQAKALGRDPELAELKRLFLAIAGTAPLSTLEQERLFSTICTQTKMKATTVAKCFKEARVELGLDNQPAASATWLNKLRKSDAGNPKAVIANAVVAFREAPEWRDILFFDEFTNRVVIRGQAPWMKSTQEIHWPDHFDVEGATWLQHKDIDVTPTMVAQAVDLVARDNAFHPVREYLESLVWDNKPRLNQWLTYYLGAEPDAIEPDAERSEAQRLFASQAAYLKTIGRLWMISAVARIFQPGCKADCALILEGPQGKKKSTAINTLANPWFADELSEFGSKESAILIAGVWIVELAELSALHRSDIERAKSYISRKTDHYRPVWGRRWIDQPRQCVFAGTTNSHEYLNDPTGGRRWWPVKCGNIDIEALISDRDQLWAEALTAFRAGEKWHLEDNEIIKAAVREQEARGKTDIWDDHIRRFLVEQTRVAGLSGNKIFVTKSDILRDIGVLAREQTQVHANRVADCLTRFGWERFRIGWGSLRGTWAYRPKEGTSSNSGNEND